MVKQRSPRFPFIPLRAALGHLNKIHAAAGDEPIRRLDAIKALGHEKPNGQVQRQIAALRGYGLIEPTGDDKPVFVVTELGKRLLKASGSKAKGPWLVAAREAVLNPPMFARLWRNLRDLSREQLVEALMQRDFTEQGAEKAAQVFTRNRQIAALDDLPEAAEAPVPRPQRAAAKKKAAARVGANRLEGRKRPGPPRDAVVLPLGKKRAVIPTGISQADYDLLLETLTLWKDRIVCEKA